MKTKAAICCLTILFSAFFSYKALGQEIKGGEAKTLAFKVFRIGTFNLAWKPAASLRTKVGSEEKYPGASPLYPNAEAIHPEAFKNTLILNIESATGDGQPLEIALAKQGEKPVPIFDIKDPSAYQYHDTTPVSGSVSINGVKVAAPFSTFVYQNNTVIFRSGRTYLAISSVSVNGRTWTYKWKYWAPAQ